MKNRGKTKSVLHIDEVAFYYCPYIPPSISYTVKYKKNHIVCYNVFEDKMKEILYIINEYNLEYKISKYKTNCIILKAKEEQIFYFKISELFNFNKEK